MNENAQVLMEKPIAPSVENTGSPFRRRDPKGVMPIVFSRTARMAGVANSSDVDRSSKQMPLGMTN
jgi:hypothetical protein